MRTYNYGLNMNLIHSIHLIFGVWAVKLGYFYLRGITVSNIENIILIVLGVVMSLYQSWLWIKYPKTMYHYNVPGWLVNSTHILSGLLLIFLGYFKQQFNFTYDMIGIIMIILGSMAALYHLHIFALGDHEDHDH